ncbi:hypothetical protein COV15_01735 [Candidatus Woesearchaeota archaeon CG10_big_fil_rev_8_21_14_0_10_34_12]|nr:MAG: hypothetical protein COV15_01735 [Candidatus Woesearchaeota archaeon CG10_big_fil_rev_8_21_14_0_10_34_12]
MKIILDTNFLIYCAKYKIDWQEEIKRIFGKAEIIIPCQVLQELEQKSKEKNAKIALLISEKAIEEEKAKIKILGAENTDLAVEKLGKNNIIASMDKGIKAGKRLVIRQKNHLELIE